MLSVLPRSPQWVVPWVAGQLRARRRTGKAKTAPVSKRHTASKIAPLAPLPGTSDVMCRLKQHMEASEKPVALENSRPPTRTVLWSGVACFASMSALSLAFHSLPESEALIMLGSMGASAALIGAAPSLDVSQPRNVIAGHTMSTLIGLGWHAILTEPLQNWCIAGPIAVSTATVAMLLTRTMHPPAGGTALMAAMGTTQLQHLGAACLMPVVASSVCLVLAGTAVNRSLGRRYPKYWW